MTEQSLREWTVDEARSTASGTAAQGAAWLIAFGITLTIAAVLSFFLPLEVAVLVAVFQGGVALPLAFALERRLGTAPMAPDHPLRSLSIQLAMVQIVALPAVIMMYTQNPALVPAVFAAIGGAHFLPYVWLHQTKIYLYLALAVALGSWAITLAGGEAAYRWVMIWWPVCYAVAAALLWRRHRQLQASGQATD
ncbi:hypothetical protein [Arthrobacter sp.]|uniref:DUF7010 family protein n=1 Tax=Arthrobacter sp. TaxID=1667 RepID=UPI0033959714